jgi:hypothetical protein
MIRWRSAACALLLLLSAAGCPVSAHHAFASFDLRRTRTVRATLRLFEWTEPHSWLDVIVVDDQGQSARASFQCLDPPMLRRKGWSKRRLRVGETLLVNYFPNRDGSPGGAVRTVQFPDGTVLAAYDFPVQR